MHIFDCDGNVTYAHCDGPCGVYDPANARIAAEAVYSIPTCSVRVVGWYGPEPELKLFPESH